MDNAISFQPNRSNRVYSAQPLIIEHKHMIKHWHIPYSFLAHFLANFMTMGVPSVGLLYLFELQRQRSDQKEA
jgi:hypothetical protein